ncbi:MAG TPA: hypothetical protein VEQ41_02755 [Solirubrobacterales bacterium]|nr:hypothetical protein [Solirubrobacterales bacterium]
MHSQPTPRGHSQVAVQRAILCLTLDAYPLSLTISTLSAEVDQVDVVERAVADLCRVGLLSRSADSISATVAAVHFDLLGL